MKKNNMLRIASVLLVAVLLSTSAIAGVFAQYYKSDDVAESAKVAKWGVTITANEDNDDEDLFYTSYDLNATDKTVVANGSYDVVAPGTLVSAWTPFVLGGQPEVDVKVEYIATVDLEGWTVGGEFYCPVVFTVGTTEIKMDATNNTADKLEAAIKAAIDAYTAEYEENQDLADNATVKVPTLSWSWAFGDKDAKDTALGDAAAAGNAASINIEIALDVTQID